MTSLYFYPSLCHVCDAIFRLGEKSLSRDPAENFGAPDKQIMYSEGGVTALGGG